MALTVPLPKNPTLPQISTALSEVETRLTAIEKDYAALREELRLRNTAARLKWLEEEQVAKNINAIRAILTLLHPDTEHPDVPVEQEWLHDLVMHWIDEYGGRVKAST